jgi:hypothetical protein
MPPPQLKEHEDHAVHEVTTQSAGQAAVLQAWSAVREPHAAPELTAAVVTLRVWVWEPEPQVALQEDQLPQSLRTQSTGQTTAVLQSWVLEVAGQAVPSVPAWAVVTARVAELTPLPHVREHEDQLPHSATTQSAQVDAHVVSCSVVAGQAVPPYASNCWMARSRERDAAVHVPAQSVHAAQSETRQGSGQLPSLHAGDSERSVGQAAPAPTWAVVTARVRVLVPSPHDTLQLP